ncbi:MAG: hypothetical protein KAV87_17150, partial [Desulfobacteraceae bacterium]|nr:hypothetical protein [Desulfobacteraceae bacterium]
MTEKKIKNPVLYNSFSKLARKLAAMLNEEEVQDAPQKIPAWRIPKIREFEEFQQFKDDFDQAMGSKLRIIYEEMDEESIDTFITETAFNSIVVDPRPEFREEFLRKVYEDLERCIYKEPDYSRVYAYLSGFESDIKCFEVDDFLKIREADLLERAFMRKIHADREMFGSANSDFPNFVIETKPSAINIKVSVSSEEMEKEEKIEDRPAPTIKVKFAGGDFSMLVNRWREKIENLVTALRILQPCNLGIEEILFEIVESDTGIRMISRNTPKPELFPGRFSRLKYNRFLFNTFGSEFIRHFWSQFL